MQLYSKIFRIKDIQRRNSRVVIIQIIASNVPIGVNLSIRKIVATRTYIDKWLSGKNL